MDQTQVREHWEDWAKRFGRDLRATTKTSTAKRLEIDALQRAIDAHASSAGGALELLEVGCGNAYNCIALAQAFPRARLTGVDYVAAMIEMARANVQAAALSERISLEEGDVLALGEVAGLRDRYDVVVTDRCLINLGSVELQKRAITLLAERVASGGLLLLIENSQQSYERQNECRRELGLPSRTPEPFNLFFDEREILPHLADELEVIAVEDFISLHDLVLYVLVPAVNGGRVDYQSPLVEAVTKLCLALPPEDRGQLGPFGQNRLFICRRP